MKISSCSLDPNDEQQLMINRKNKPNLPAQRKALKLYNAPVVDTKFRNVISHFKRSKNSLPNAQKLAPISVFPRNEG